MSTLKVQFAMRFSYYNCKSHFSRPYVWDWEYSDGTNNDPCAATYLGPQPSSVLSMLKAECPQHFLSLVTVNCERSGLDSILSVLCFCLVFLLDSASKRVFCIDLGLKMQVQNPHSIKYSGTVQGLKYIWRTEGFRGLFKGNGSNCARIVPNSAVKFFSYEEASKYATMPPVVLLILFHFVILLTFRA